MPLSRRQIYRRRRITVFGTLAVVLAVAFYLPTTLLAPLPRAAAVLTPVSVATPAAATITWPSYGASAIGSTEFDGVLAKSGSSAQLPMASISKLITMLVVLQKKPLTLTDSGPTITFGATDVGYYSHYLALNGTVEPVHVGLQLTELEAMETALIPSANNYAASVSTWAYGSQSAFLSAAHAWLKKNGLTSITFLEPTGIDPSNTATASDLVLLGKLAHANPVLEKIDGTKKLAVAGVGTLKNTNGLLGLGGVTGIKTGTLDSFGANLLFSANRRVGSRTITLIGVVLGATSHPVLDKDLKVMLTGVMASFHDVSLTTTGKKFGSYTTAWGTSALVAEKTRSVLVWGAEPVTVHVTSTPVAVGSRGADVGTATFSVAGATIRVPLELARSVADPGPVWRLGHPSELL